MTEPAPQPTTAPVAPDKRWGGRLPQLAPADLDPEQQALYDQLQAGPLPWAARAGFATQDDAGHLIGPFNVFLHSPRISRSYNDLIGVEMSQTELSAPVREIVILTVGVEWQADYETYAHAAVARAVGLSGTVITAVLPHSQRRHRTGGRRPRLHPTARAQQASRRRHLRTGRVPVRRWGPGRHGAPDRLLPHHVRPAQRL